MARQGGFVEPISDDGKVKRFRVSPAIDIDVEEGAGVAITIYDVEGDPIFEETIPIPVESAPIWRHVANTLEKLPEPRVTTNG